MNEIVSQNSEYRARRTWLSWHRLVLVGILLLAVFVRLWRLGELPPGLQHDEAYNGLDAIALLDGKTFPIFHEGWELYADDAHGERPIYASRVPPFFEGNYGREPFLVYLVAASIWLSDITRQAIRIVPAIFGIVSVLVTYLVARVLSGPARPRRRVSEETDQISPYIGPLAAAFMMAIFYPAVTFSRIGLRAMLFVPVGALTVYLFWRGIVSSEKEGEVELDNLATNIPSIPLGLLKAGWFAAAGFFLGLGIYIYAAARFMPLAFIAFLFLWWLQDRDVVKRHWANFLIFVVVSIAVSAPLLLFLFRQPYYLIYRSRFISNRGAGTYPGQPWITWALNIPRLVRGFIWQGDVDILHNLPGRPLLDPIQLILTATGTVRMFLKRARLGNQFIAVWFAAMLLPGIVSGDAPHFGRLIGLAVPLAIIMGIGAEWIYILANSRLENRYRSSHLITGLLLLFLFVVSTGITLRDYFIRYAEHPDLPSAFNLSDWQLGEYAAGLPEEATIYLSPTQEEMATIHYALQGDDGRLRSFFSPESTLIPAGQRDDPVYYLVASHDDSTFERIALYFPTGTSDLTPLTFNAFGVPASSRWIASGADENISWGGAISLQDWNTEISDEKLEVTLTWKAKVPMERSYTAFVHLLSSDGDLIAQLDRLPDGYLTSDWHEDEIVIDTFGLSLPADLQPGRYIVQTGFYHLPTLERLGEPQVLGDFTIR